MKINHTITKSVSEIVELDAEEVFAEIRYDIMFNLDIPKSAWYDEKESILRYSTEWSTDTKEISDSALEIFKALNVIKNYLGKAKK